MHNIYFHIAAFEGNKLSSLKLDFMDWGVFNHLVNESFQSLWYKILEKVWAQWRYENNLPFYQGPEMKMTSNPKNINAIKIREGDIKVLMLCSGGKDSLACLNIMSQAG